MTYYIVNTAREYKKKQSPRLSEHSVQCDRKAQNA